MELNDTAVTDIGIDGVAIKPSTIDVSSAGSLPVDLVTVDFEGREYFPSLTVIDDLAHSRSVRVTIPIRANGFDPLGDHRVLDQLLGRVDFVFVAGHPAYLTQEELSRAIHPRIRKARSMASGGWIGTEGIRGIVRDVNAPVFALLSPDITEWVQRVRSTGFDESIAVYAPTLISTDPDIILEHLGDYVARRGPVREQLAGHSFDNDRHVSGVKDVLVTASSDYALVGDRVTISNRVRTLKSAGIDRVIAYPARGPDVLFGA